MTTSESLRDALADLERSLSRERELRAQSEALLAGLNALSRERDPERGIHVLLSSLAESLGATDAGLLALTEQGGLRCIAATTRAWLGEFPGLSAAVVQKLLSTRPRAYFDTAAIHLARELPEALRSQARSALLVPLKGARQGLLLCGHAATGRFSPSHLRFAQRLAPLAERALAEVALRQALDERDRFFALSPDLLCILVGDQEFRHVNSAWRSLLGFSEADLLGRSFLDLLPPGQRAACGEHDATLQREGSVSFENDCRHADGSLRRIAWSFAIEPETTMCYGRGRDVTEQRAAERALAREQEFTRVLLATVGAVILVFDRDGAVVDINRAGEEISGYTKAELQAGPSFEHLIPADELPMVRERVAELRRSKIPNRGDNHWLRRDGGKVWISWSNTVLLDSAGEVEFVVATGIDLTERRDLEDRLRHAALHDALTGLPNRAALRDYLIQALARCRRWPEYGFALLYLDLDGFKPVNDRFGHQAGDAVLEGVALRLRGCLRTVDTVARLGGDEFAVILDGVRSREDAAAAIRRIEQAVSLPFPISGREVQVGVSVGLALSAAGVELDALLSAADAEMYRVKAARKAAAPASEAARR